MRMTVWLHILMLFGIGLFSLFNLLQPMQHHAATEGALWWAHRTTCLGLWAHGERRSAVALRRLWLHETRDIDVTEATMLLYVGHFLYLGYCGFSHIVPICSNILMIPYPSAAGIVCHSFCKNSGGSLWLLVPRTWTYMRRSKGVGIIYLKQRRLEVHPQQPGSWASTFHLQK